MVVFLHGFLGLPSHFDDLRTRLDRRDRGTALLLPGHGRGAPLPNTSTWAETIALLSASVPRGAVLVGYSLGARLALGIAASRDDLAALIFVSGHCGLSAESDRASRRASDEEKVKQLFDRGMGAFADAWGEEPIVKLYAASEEARAARALARRVHEPAGIGWSLRVLGLAAMPDLAAALRSRPYPVHLVTGELDPKFSAIAASLAGGQATHHRAPGAGHDVVLDAPAFLATVLAPVLATIESPP